jgi:hypothetical protein
MSQSPKQPMDPYTTTLLRVAEYLSRPQQFVAVAEAPAAFWPRPGYGPPGQCSTHDEWRTCRGAGVFCHTGGYAWRITASARRGHGAHRSLIFFRVSKISMC